MLAFLVSFRRSDREVYSFSRRPPSGVQRVCKGNDLLSIDRGLRSSGSAYRWLNRSAKLRIAKMATRLSVWIPIPFLRLFLLANRLILSTSPPPYALDMPSRMRLHLPTRRDGRSSCSGSTDDYPDSSIPWQMAFP